MATTRTRKRRASSRDPLQVQLSFRVKRIPGVTITGDVLREAVAYRLAHGADAPGIKTRIVQWRNPARKSAELRAWREGSQEAAWDTLRNALEGWIAGSDTISVEFKEPATGARTPRKTLKGTRRKVRPSKRPSEKSRAKKARRSAEWKRRSTAARKGWETRRRNERRHARQLAKRRRARKLERRKK